jgi:hypothetical protein
MVMRNPPALKAILVLHGSEDLYANDVHNIDGALHLDIFTQEMETANLMPRSPDYAVDAAYFRDRFTSRSSISLVTGGIANGTQRLSRTEPAPIPRKQPIELTIPMRFTTYTMEPGHRLQLVVTNAQFPMIWPTPYAMTTKLFMGGGASRVTVPFVASNGPPADYLLKLSPESDPTPPGDFREIAGALGPAPVPVVTRDGSIVHAKQSEDETWSIDAVTYMDEEAVDYSVDERDPAKAGFEGEGQASVRGGGARCPRLFTRPCPLRCLGFPCRDHACRQIARAIAAANDLA